MSIALASTHTRTLLKCGKKKKEEEKLAIYEKKIQSNIH